MRAPVGRYLAALGGAAVAPLLALGVLAQFGFADDHPVVLAQVLCAGLACVMALRWPAHGWRWGLWVSSGFWLFLGLAFGGYLRIGRLLWLPLGQAAAVTAAACAGGWLGGLPRRRRTPSPATSGGAGVPRRP